MNRTYRLVWNEESQRHVPAPEVARGRGKHGGRSRTVAAAVALGLGGLTPGAWALDAGALSTGGQVTAGQATLTPVAGAAQLTVNQSSQRAVIDWASYNVGSGARVQYVQPGSSSVTLNRVVGNEASQILGRIDANGQVFLVNANGVLFGKGAQVNVQGLVASTLDIGNADFMAGRLRFAGMAGAVSNEGTITAGPDGYVALLGGQVSNSGQVSAQLGSVALAAGSDVTLDFGGDGLLQVAVNAGAVQAQIESSGLIRAEGGRVVMTARAADDLISAVVNQSGTVQARGLVERAGVIELSGDVVNQSGTLDVSASQGTQGGQVTISGRSLVQGGTILADGVQGGGRVSLQATNALLQTESGRISAQGGSGAGGQVVLGGGETAYLSGQVDASGAQGGQIVASAGTITLGRPR